MKRRFAMAAMTAMSLLPALPAVAETRWDLYSFVGITHPIAVQLQQFGDEVKKRSNGDLSISVRPAGELPFKANEVVKITGDGQVQLGESLALFTTGSVPLTGVTGLPMFLRTPQDMEKAMPIIQKYAAKDFAKAGVKILFHYQWPAVNIFGSGKPIRTIADFSGRKLRTLSPQEAEMLRRLGAASVSLTTAEVPVALERGTIEGVMTTGFNMVGSKWADFSKWGYIANFHGADDFILVNTAAYEKLSPSTRKVLDDVAREWAPKMTKVNLASEATSLDTMRTKNKVDIVTATPADADKMTERMKEYWESWAQQTGPDAVAMLKEIRAAIGR
jgi:TRAP-type C4-dicarboxylate transport system substrate-binding protein